MGFIILLVMIINLLPFLLKITSGRGIYEELVELKEKSTREYIQEALKEKSFKELNSTKNSINNIFNEAHKQLKLEKGDGE